MKTLAQLNEALNEATGAVRSYRGSDLYTAFIVLLDAVDECQLESLAYAKPDDVLRIQGAISQARALRNTLFSTALHASPLG